MCAGPFKPSKPAPPPEDKSAKAMRQRERIRQQEETSKLKEQRYEERVAAAYGRMGRRSLLSGRRGGTGFQLQENLMSKKTLGA